MKMTRGFTLVELLVVLAIVAVLAGLGFPVVSGFVARSREAACLNNLRSMGVALEGYMQENNQKLPILATGRASKNEDIPVIETALLPYLEDPSAFHCPQDRVEFEKSGSSYSWLTLANGQQLASLTVFNIKDRSDKIPLIYDKESWHPSGSNFLYADLSSSNKERFAAGN